MYYSYRIGLIHGQQNPRASPWVMCCAVVVDTFPAANLPARATGGLGGDRSSASHPPMGILPLYGEYG